MDEPCKAAARKTGLFKLKPRPVPEPENLPPSQPPADIPKPSEHNKRGHPIPAKPKWFVLNQASASTESRTIQLERTGAPVGYWIIDSLFVNVDRRIESYDEKTHYRIVFREPGVSIGSIHSCFNMLCYLSQIRLCKQTSICVSIVLTTKHSTKGSAYMRMGSSRHQLGQPPLVPRT